MKIAHVCSIRFELLIPHDFLLNRCLSDKAIYVHRTFLTNTMRTIHCLQILHRIPIMLDKYHHIGACQIKAFTTDLKWNRIAIKWNALCKGSKKRERWNKSRNARRRTYTSSQQKNVDSWIVVEVFSNCMTFTNRHRAIKNWISAKLNISKIETTKQLTWEGVQFEKSRSPHHSTKKKQKRHERMCHSSGPTIPKLYHGFDEASSLYWSFSVNEVKHQKQLDKPDVKTQLARVKEFGDNLNRWDSLAKNEGSMSIQRRNLITYNTKYVTKFRYYYHIYTHKKFDEKILTSSKKIMCAPRHVNGSVFIKNVTLTLHRVFACRIIFQRADAAFAK